MIIETERLILREWKLSDIGDMVEGLNSFEVAKNLVTPFPYTSEDAKQYITKHIKHSDCDYHFAIVLKENKEVIGGTSLSVDKQIGKAGGGVWLKPKHFGKGYGTEVYIARIKFAFENLKIKTLEEDVYVFNESSKHLHEKLGFKIVGESNDYNNALKKEVKGHLYKLTKEDFYKAIEKIKK